MGTRRCCCGARLCWAFSDDFNRTDSTNLGSDWTEDSGDWEIKDEMLYEPGTPGALAVCNQQVNIASAGEMHVQVEAKGVSPGMTYYLYGAYNPDTDTYFKGKFVGQAKGGYHLFQGKGRGGFPHGTGVLLAKVEENLCEHFWKHLSFIRHGSVKPTDDFDLSRI